MTEGKVRNYDADSGIARKGMTSTVSATETTGIMYKPPRDPGEFSSLRGMYGLQSAEFAAVDDPDSSGGAHGSDGSAASAHDDGWRAARRSEAANGRRARGAGGPGRSDEHGEAGRSRNDGRH